MKKYLFKASIVTGISAVLSGIVVGIVKFKKNHPMKLRDYTKYALYMAVLDDEIVRNELGEGSDIEDMEGEIIWPHRMETLKDRYEMFLELNKGKTEKMLMEEVERMEERVKASRN